MPESIASASLIVCDYICRSEIMALDAELRRIYMHSYRVCQAAVALTKLYKATAYAASQELLHLQRIQPTAAATDAGEISRQVHPHARWRNLKSFQVCLHRSVETATPF